MFQMAQNRKIKHPARPQAQDSRVLWMVRMSCVAMDLTLADCSHRRTRTLVGYLGLGGLTVALLGSRSQEDAAFAAGGSATRAVNQKQELSGGLATPAVCLRGAGGAEARASEPGASSAAAVVCGAVVCAAAAARAGGRRTARRSNVLPLAALSERSERREPAATARDAVRSETSQMVTDVNPLDGPDGTYQVGIDFKNWLQSATEEIEVGNLRVEGKLPVWLRGSLVHAGPAKFEFGPDEFVDWVDGQAMLYRLRINADGECEYRNRWLNTWNHRMHKEKGRIAVRETCSRPSIDSIVDRFLYLFQPPNNENGNLHISQMVGSRPVSMSVGSAVVEFTLPDMETLGKVPWDDEMVDEGPLIFHSEPHIDKKTGEWYTSAIQLKIEGMGLKPEYVVFSVMPDAS
ncbi:unnamed protein product, partial [Polarella glacialis]